VAWTNVCTTKELGGLGIREFGTHNICLLLNLVHHLHCADASAWAQWIRGKADIANMKGENLGHHWELLQSLLPLYQALTTVELGDGRSTLLWTDVWNGDEALEDRLPRLFSHCTRKDSTVQQAINSNLHGCFVNRMSTQANDELRQLKVILQQTQLTDQPDTRLSAFSRTKDRLDTSAIYRLLKAQGHQDDPSSAFIWKNAAPPWVQMFFWLLLRGRIQCRANLYRKNIVDLPNCLVCGMDDETPDHLIFECPIAAQFWRGLGIQPDGLHCRNWHHIQRVSGIPDDQYSAFIMMCCWVLWKRRNAFVFRDEVIPIRTIFLQCKSESANWKARMPKRSKRVAEDWSTVLQMAINSVPM